MKTILFIVSILILASCVQDKKTNTENQKSSIEISDTIIFKHKNTLNESYEVGFYSKSYSYYWLKGKDTLDLILNVTEFEKDSTLDLNIIHENPILFSAVLSEINKCLPLIKQDFDISKLSSICFKSPIYYLDLTKELSSEYEQNFGRRNISYSKLNQFLLKSSLTTRLNNFLNPLVKKTKRYHIEKFHLIDKKYYRKTMTKIDFTEFPEFSISGMDITVQLENK